MNNQRLGRLRLRQRGAALPPLPRRDAWELARGFCVSCGARMETRTIDGDDEYRCREQCGEGRSDEQ